MLSSTVVRRAQEATVLECSSASRTKQKRNPKAACGNPTVSLHQNQPTADRVYSRIDESSVHPCRAEPTRRLSPRFIVYAFLAAG
jgi:hypothetical protein